MQGRLAPPLKLAVEVELRADEGCVMSKRCQREEINKRWMGMACMFRLETPFHAV